MNFVKMQAAGNDFVLIDARYGEQDWPELAKAMCHRRLGVGADGLLLVLPSEVADLKMQMFNPDGSEAEACGNGLRCLAKYAVEEGLVAAEDGGLSIETMAGLRRARVFMTGDEVARVEVSMGAPELSPGDIPLALGEGHGKLDIKPVLDYPLTVSGLGLRLSFVSMGNPHAVHFMEEPVESFPLAEIGPLVENHPLFPQRTNFEIVNLLGRRQARARVWERGAGETLACGSGACAIAVAARLHGYTDDQLEVSLPGGTLTLSWDGEGEVVLSGPAETVFRGQWSKRWP
ncbi:MAG TPA: diaminopimelate epimerase [Dehalococcoidia bacterium]|nr:diaminopimelate epimerase [Dehalococcoidia bacterium]